MSTAKSLSGVGPDSCQPGLPGAQNSGRPAAGNSVRRKYPVAAAATVRRGEDRGTGSASKRVRRRHLHFGVSGHGEAVQAVGDDSQAGGDQECCSVGLGPECFEGPVESGGRVRLRTTRRDDD